MGAYTQLSSLRISGVGNFKIAIFGSAESCVDPIAYGKAKLLGDVLGSLGVRVVTGGCVGTPSVVARHAKRRGSKIIGFFPDKNEQKVSTNIHHSNDVSFEFDDRFYFDGYSERSLAMIRWVDSAIVVGGRIGTISEWAMALEENLPVLVLQESGGVADHLEYILKVAKKEFPENIILFAKDIESGVMELLRRVRERKNNP